MNQVVGSYAPTENAPLPAYPTSTSQSPTRLRSLTIIAGPFLFFSAIVTDADLPPLGRAPHSGISMWLTGQLIILICLQSATSAIFRWYQTGQYASEGSDKQHDGFNGLNPEPFLRWVWRQSAGPRSTIRVYRFVSWREEAYPNRDYAPSPILLSGPMLACFRSGRLQHRISPRSQHYDPGEESATLRPWNKLALIPSAEQRSQLEMLLANRIAAACLYWKSRKGPVTISGPAFNEAIERWKTPERFWPAC